MVIVVEEMVALEMMVLEMADLVLVDLEDLFSEALLGDY